MREYIRKDTRLKLELFLESGIVISDAWSFHGVLSGIESLV
jgi:hypothetical protein